jgi:signal transduction histidine kinase
MVLRDLSAAGIDGGFQMRRKQGIASLVAGTVVLLALLAVFAVEISNNQSNSRRNLETQAHQRAQLVAGLLETVFQAISQPAPALLATYGRPKVSDTAMQRNRGDSLFVALLAPDGRLLAHSSGFTAQAAATIAAPGAVSAVQHGQAWYLGNSSPYGSTGVIDFATWLHTRAGKRILLTGLKPSSISGFVADELAKIPGAQGHHSSVIDGNKTVVASTNLLHPPGYHFHTKAQLAALSHGSGVVHSLKGDKYFDQVPLGGTSWKIILSLPAGEFFASVSGIRHWLPWILLVAFGLAMFVAVGLVARLIGSQERIRLINLALGRSNDELERQAQELVRSNSELDQFASIASHDLQEPLRKVRTFTERVSDTEAENLSERGQDYLRRANSSAERMQVLIEDLLRYSRVTTHARPFVPVDLAAVTAEVLDDLSEQVRRADADVQVGTLPTISADAPQMRQLLQNLISNALKFRRDGVPLVVRIDGEVRGDWLTLTVADNGIGFDPQYAQRIFRVFERLHGRGSYPGTGIGLALCRKIAERHGGTVVASAVPGEGATFTVTVQTERSEAVNGTSQPVAPDAPAAAVTQTDPYVAA